MNPSHIHDHEQNKWLIFVLKILGLEKKSQNSSKNSSITFTQFHQMSTSYITSVHNQYISVQEISRKIFIKCDTDVLFLVQDAILDHPLNLAVMSP